MNTSYQETLDFLYQQLPMFQRMGSSAFKKDLKNIQALCKVLNHPEKKFKSIHIAGTNGKGSTAHILSAVLQKARFERVGLYSSPHLIDFRERIKINSKLIEKDFVVDFVAKIKKEIQSIQPSFFEITVAMAFEYFAQQKVDFAIIETGLGGRLDSTNVITPELSIITNIAYDHCDMLGETLAEIAGEKAGIIKADVPVIIGESHLETKNIFLEKANEKRAQIRFADQFYDCKVLEKDFEHQALEIRKNKKIIFEKLKTDLLGDYQIPNIKTALASIEQLNRMGFWIDEKSIKQGLEAVKRQTYFLGRWQILSKNPLVICDTGHNEAGIQQVLHQIKKIKFEKLHFVFGMVNDKSTEKILKLLPQNAQYYFCKANIPRGLDAKILQEKAQDFNLKGKHFESVEKAFLAAKGKAQSKDLIFIGGSIFVVGEILEKAN